MAALRWKSSGCYLACILAASLLLARPVDSASVADGADTCDRTTGKDEVLMLQTELKLQVRKASTEDASTSNRTEADASTGARREDAAHAAAATSNMTLGTAAGRDSTEAALSNKADDTTAPTTSDGLMLTMHAFTPILAVLLILVLCALLQTTLGSQSRGPDTGAGKAAAASRLLMPDPAQDPGPPAICPSLVLPNSEARFMISMHSIMTADALEIRGTSGRKLLTATFGGGAVSQQQHLSLACVGCEDDPRCIVSTAGGGTLTVFGRRREHYGEIEKSEPPRCQGAVLTCRGQPVMLVEVLKPESLHVVVSTPGKRLLAEGRCKEEPSRSASGSAGPWWQLEVKPGADAVLIVSSILSITRLWKTAAAG
eukprot:TRINITY_DN109048_c0_g1_i1.p1 TRINITY_DN109048_c0_g1~~TRINITY_DN109048_c0_g1_i1.p1  ORF type:complete len:371 (-),score=91.57 TRINITY_DN109048_c0_g1_i1:19-1131(-)